MSKCWTDGFYFARVVRETPKQVMLCMDSLESFPIGFKVWKRTGVVVGNRPRLSTIWRPVDETEGENDDS